MVVPDLRALAPWADDVCVVAGACLIGVGVYRVWPNATWFYSGACLVIYGVLLALGRKRGPA